MAEDIQDWFRDGVYSDLVTLEEHLASLASVILLAVESPGSIAELGAFSVLRPISNRLIAIVDEGEFEQDSFIRLGPIKRLESDTKRPVLVHDWHAADHLGKRTIDYEKLRPEVAEILESARAMLRENKGEQIFKIDEPSHVMLLVCELCDLFGALSKQEIENYVFSIEPSFKSQLMDQYLFLLEKCSILRIKAKGHGRYYYTPDWVSHVTFSFNDGPRVDRDRVRVDVVEYYRSYMKTRAEVIRLLRKAA